MVKQNRDLGRVAVEYCRQRGLMGVLRELAARKERQRAWKKAMAHVPPVAPVVAPDLGAVISDLAGVRSGSTAETPVAQQDSAAALNANIGFAEGAWVATGQPESVDPRPALEIAIVEPVAERPLAEIVPPKPDLATNLERALATLRAQMEEAT